MRLETQGACVVDGMEDDRLRDERLAAHHPTVCRTEGVDEVCEVTRWHRRLHVGILDTETGAIHECDARHELSALELARHDDCHERGCLCIIPLGADEAGTERLTCRRPCE